MNVSDYKKEVDRISLSYDFKEQLKEKCLEEVQSTMRGYISMSDDYSSDDSSKMRLYKYVAIVACFIAAVSTIGTASLLSNNFSVKKSDNADYNLTADLKINEDSEKDISEPSFVAPTSPDSYSLEAPAEANESDVSAPNPYPMESAGIDNDTEILQEPDVDNYEPDVPEDTPVEDEALTNSGSLNAEGYTGDYFTEDYVLFSMQQNTGATANVYDDYKTFESNSNSDYSAYTRASAKPASLDNSLQGDDAEVETFDDSDDVGEPVEAYDASKKFTFGEGVTVSYPKAYNFYDVLGNQLKDASDTLGVSLVRMTIRYPITNVNVPVPKSGGYSLYYADIEYDYLNQKSSNETVYVWLKGTQNDQILGMPTYTDGDTIIASVLLRKDGFVSLVDELIYDVYSLNGLDVAYHRVYEDVNPGNTNMGVLDVEREYLTTTDNNPALYVHKASVKELTRYIRRKIISEEYKICDLSELSLVSLGLKAYGEADTVSASTQPVEEPVEEKAVKSIKINAPDSWMEITASGERIYLGDETSTQKISSLYKNSSSGTSGGNSSSTALFIGGRLSFNNSSAFTGELTEIEITNAGCPLDIGFKGVRIGDSLADTLNAFGVNRNLENDSKITVSSDTITAVFSFEGGIITKISIKLK